MAIGHWLKNFTKWYFDPGAEPGGGDRDVTGRLLRESDGVRVTGYSVDINIPPGPAVVSNEAFNNCVELASVTIPSTVTQIAQNAFSGCVNLANVDISDDVIGLAISSAAFRGCTRLTAITLPAGVTGISGNAFNECTNLREINCRFAEGAVSGAPWGATNATINYNV